MWSGWLPAYLAARRFHEWKDLDNRGVTMRLIAFLMSLFLGTFAAALPLSAQSESFAGEWKTDWGQTTVFRDGSGFRGSYKSEDGNAENSGTFTFSKTGKTWTGFWAESRTNKECSTERMGTRYWGTLALATPYSTDGFSMSWNYCDNKEPGRRWVFSKQTNRAEASTSGPVYKPSSALREIKSGFWTGAARSDSQGKASYCYLQAHKTNGEFTIQLYWNAQGFHVLIFSSDWSLNKGDEFRGRVRIDSRFDELVEASIFDSESIDYVFGFDLDAINAFQAGKRITLEGPAGKKSFQLIGTRGAVDVLVDCADEFLVDENEPELALEADFNVGLSAYQDGDFSTAMANWLALAEDGDARSQTYVGEMYRDAEGVAEDLAEAVFWFQLAAEQGDARAQNNLGISYYGGNGIQREFADAVFWFRKAAEQGSATAQTNLGEMYRDGEGVERNNAEAIQWFRKAAEQGQDRAQRNLDAMLALRDEPEDVISPQPDATPAVDPTIAPTQKVFKPDQEIEVEFGNLPAEGQDWLAISASDHSPEQYYEFVMLEGKPSDGRHLFNSLPEGEYEARLYLNWPDGSYQIAARSKVIVSSVSALPGPAQPLPTPTAPQPTEPVPPVAPVVIAVPISPVIPDPEPSPEITDFTGRWAGGSGAFKSITFEQMGEFVDGTATGPEGFFEGKIWSGTLIGFWANTESSDGTACPTEQLGFSIWGSLEAKISDDGKTLIGAWGECNNFRTHSIRMTRDDSVAVLPQADPIQQPPAKPAPEPDGKIEKPTRSEEPEPSPEIVEPTVSEEVEPEIAETSTPVSEYIIDDFGFVQVSLAPLPSDPFKGHPAPRVPLPNANIMAAYIPMPNNAAYEELQPPMLAPEAPRSIGEDVPAWDSWPYADIGNMTFGEIKAALEIENIIPSENLRTIRPASWNDVPGGMQARVPDTGDGTDLEKLWGALKGNFDPPVPYIVDGVAMDDTYGGNAAQTPQFTGWDYNGSDRMTQYQDGHKTGLVFEFSSGKVDELQMPIDDSHQLIIEFHEETGKTSLVEQYLLHDGGEDADGPTYWYFPDGTPRCVINFKYFAAPDSSVEHGRKVCMNQDGFMNSDYQYVEGDKTGVWKAYKDGRLKELETYSQDRKNGIHVQYRGENLEHWRIYKDGQRNGLYRSYEVNFEGVNYLDEQGANLEDSKAGYLWRYSPKGLLWINLMENGQEISRPFEMEDETGFVNRMIIAANDTRGGQILTFNYEGDLEVVENIDENDLKSTEIRAYDGYLTRRSSYQNGQEHGLTFSYYTESDGGGRPLNTVITYVKGEQKGRAIRYWYDGELDYDEMN